MIKISKYHGLGNDFVMVKDSDLGSVDYSKLAIKLCDRHTGIGADGLISVKTAPSLEMIYYNSDGSRAKMCGNGIRCFANYVYDEGITKELNYTVSTLSGDMVINVMNVEPFNVEVNMGIPSYETKDIPMNIDSNEFIKEEIIINDKSLVATSLLMGVTHTVINVEKLEEDFVIGIGSKLNSHPLYPKGTNVNFVEVVDSSNINLQTFERGAGLTLACGTGACAAVAVNQRLDILSDIVTVSLPLGKLVIKRLIDSSISMSGPAEKVFEVSYSLEELYE